MEKQIIRPYLAFDGTLCEALQHTLPHIIPPSHNDDTNYPFPQTIYRMFDYTDVPKEVSSGGLLAGVSCAPAETQNQSRKLFSNVQLEMRSGVLETRPLQNFAQQQIRLEVVLKNMLLYLFLISWF